MFLKITIAAYGTDKETNNEWYIRSTVIHEVCPCSTQTYPSGKSQITLRDGTKTMTTHTCAEILRMIALAETPNDNLRVLLGQHADDGCITVGDGE